MICRTDHFFPSSGFRVYTPGANPKKPSHGSVKPVEKSKKPTTKLIQFQFVVPVISKDFFMFTSSNDQ